MRTTIIPAQITTVEDKIAGSLNLNQILILMVPVLWTAGVYTLMPPVMKVSIPKLMLVLVVAILCFVLVIRIKEKIIAEWLGVIVRYHIRPKCWVYNKNDATSRHVDVPEIPAIAAKSVKNLHREATKPHQDVSVAELVKLEQLITSGKIAVRYQVGGRSQ